ncbi:MAG: hypothetical protein ACI8UO_005809 [Verrucomicrobiales bacterium]|jgi:hypothetical protein
MTDGSLVKGTSEPERFNGSGSGELRRIAFLGDYLPRLCGIATFTHDICKAVAGATQAE